MTPEEFPFVKMSGCGNDFILIDHREVDWKSFDLPTLTRLLCRRGLSIGADGLVLLLPPKDAANDFSWRFFNSDGSEAEMCGNAARCAARFAVMKGIASGPKVRFETPSGVIEAEVRNCEARVRMGEPTDLRPELTVILEEGAVEMVFLNTGVPHAVVFVEDLEGTKVVELGRKIRFHSAFSPKGTNVDFVKVIGEDLLAMRTYERGVEDETLACGTGAVASALAAHLKYVVGPPVTVRTRGGGYLRVDFKPGGGGKYQDIYLEGDARVIFEGVVRKEAFLE